jgi:hypothetical protein
MAAETFSHIHLDHKIPRIYSLLLESFPPEFLATQTPPPLRHQNPMEIHYTPCFPCASLRLAQLAKALRVAR